MATSDTLIDRIRGWPWTHLLAVAIPLASAGFQLWASLRGDEAPVWIGPVESLGVTLLALLLGLWLLTRSVRDTRARADRFHVGEALAVGYGLNFLQPTGHRLVPDHPASQLLTLASEAGGAEPPAVQRVRQLLVALPRVVDGLDNASITALRQALRQLLGPDWWIGSARLSAADAAPVPPGPDTLAGKPAGLANGTTGSDTGRGVGVTAVVHRPSGDAVLIDLPSTLAVVPHFAAFVAAQELEGSPWANELVSAGRGSIVRRFEAAKFAQVLQDGLDGLPPASHGDRSAEDLLRLRLGPVRQRLQLVPLEDSRQARPLADAIRAAVRGIDNARG